MPSLTAAELPYGVKRKEREPHTLAPLKKALRTALARPASPWIERPRIPWAKRVSDVSGQLGPVRGELLRG